MEGWSEHTFKNGDRGWSFDYPLYHAFEPRDDLRPARVIDEDSWGLPCDDPICREKWHDRDDVNHVFEDLENGVSDSNRWEIEICKELEQPESDWYLNLCFSPDMTELTPDQVGALVNDLQWMLADCRQLNDRRKESLC